jgi:phospholipase C
MKVSDELRETSHCSADLKVDLNKSASISETVNEKYQLPYPLSFEDTRATCMTAPSMGYNWDVSMWNGGLMDAWNTARDAGHGMAYFNRTDLPFYYALADAFTIGDQYF